jgi:hypothetical protein
MPRTSSGCIRPHERDTNYAAAILGADILVLEEHSASVRNTEDQHISLGNKRNYRNRLGHICDFLQERYPEYYAVGVRALSEEELANPDMYWWKNKHDLVYEGLNVKMIKAFLAYKKTKGNGKTASHVQIRKYNDAVIYGAKAATS